MARGKRAKSKLFKKFRDEEEKIKPEPVKNEGLKRIEEKCSNRTNIYFKSEEIQEICGLLNIEDLGDQQCFLGAVVIGKFDVVKKLLKDGCSIDCLDENRETALMLAVRHFRLEMVDFLVTRGADISLVDIEGNTAVQLAAQSALWDQDSFCGLWHSVRDNRGLRLDHANKAGYSLLHYVTKRQWRSALELLLCVPITVDCCTSKGVTPLIMAASRGDFAFVTALLQAGADFTLEDQQRCTALCYAIAFSLQKNVTEPNRALELILAALNDENSKMPLELYLQRRLELLANPPKSKAEFTKTVSGVVVHVLTFFARFIYSGMDLLLELAVFQRLREALERHQEDAGYTLALLATVLELVRHCDCCCQGPSQPELADAFFTAGLGKYCLNILHRYGTGKLSVVKAVFLPLLYLCTSESYKARTWLEASHAFLQPFYNKYMRSFPAMFLDTGGDPHLAIEKQCSLSFQKLMKTLKMQGYIVTKDEHSKAAQKLKEDMTLAHSVYTVIKTNSSNAFSDSFKISPEKKLSLTCCSKKKSKPSTVYNSIMQYNFGKLDLAQTKKDSPSKEQPKIQLIKKDSITNLTQPTQKPQKEIKSRIAIKEIQQKQVFESTSSENLSDENKPPSQLETLPVKTEVSNDADSNKKTSSKLVAKERFSDGFQLFQMEDETISDVENENEATKITCEWLDTYSVEGNKTVSNTEVANTLKYLEDIFNRIICRYDSTWKKQYEEGYPEAQGDCEDLLKLMTVLPALENYHMEKLIMKWNNFCKQVQDHASKNHVVYAAMVSEMQLFLLEFEAELDEKNIKLFNDNENSSVDSYLDTENVLRNINSSDVNILSSGKPIEYLINKNILVNKNEDSIKENIDTNNDDSNKDSNQVSNNKAPTESRGSIYMSDSEEDEEDSLKCSSIWEAKVQLDFKAEPKPNISIEEKASTKEEATEELINGITKSTTDVHESLANEHLSCDKNNISTQNCDLIATKESWKELVLNSSFFNTSPTEQNSLQKLSIEDVRIDSDDKNPLLGNKTETASKTLLKPPPGFEDVSPLSTGFENMASVLKFCGTKYQSLTLTLLTLPACKTELLDAGTLRLASLEFQLDFKLFNGCNFGDVELGLHSTGMPLAVRRFQKHDTLCNKTISVGLQQSVQAMLQLKHEHVLPYIVYYDLPNSLVFAMPLCYQDLGQYIRQVRALVAECPQNLPTVVPHLLTMSKQMMSGLHYLHTQDKPVVHGNLKPSNVLVDGSGALRLAEFGLHQVLFQQQGPAMTSMIWWSRDCLVEYQNTWKFECTQQSDMQSAGMLMHFILTIGQHPYGHNLSEIIQNIKNGVILLRSQDVIAMDLIYWMLSHEPDKRPTTYDVLRHVLFWSINQRWDFLLTCCGMRSKQEAWPLPLTKLYNDLDILGQLRDINTKWISILKENCESSIGTSVFEDNPSGLLQFLNKNLENWTEVKEIFLELFPVLPLNLFRLIEQTVWIDHPEFEPFTRVDPLP